MKPPFVGQISRFPKSGNDFCFWHSRIDARVPRGRSESNTPKIMQKFLVHETRAMTRNLDAYVWTGTNRLAVAR